MGKGGERAGIGYDAERVWGLFMALYAQTSQESILSLVQELGHCSTRTILHHMVNISWIRDLPACAAGDYAGYSSTRQGFPAGAGQEDGKICNIAFSPSSFSSEGPELICRSVET